MKTNVALISEQWRIKEHSIATQLGKEVYAFVGKP